MYDFELNGTSITSLDSRIIVNSISESAATLSPQTGNKPYNVGERVLYTRRTALDVTIAFNFLGLKGRGHEVDRAELLTTLCGWFVNGGWLTVNYREGKRLRVICKKLPDPQDIRNQWNEDYTVVFSAVELPFWSDAEAMTVSQLNKTSGNIVLPNNATMRSPLSIRVKNASSTVCNTFSLTVEGKSMYFTGLGLARNESLVLDYTADGMQYIQLLNTDGSKKANALNKRTIASVDDIWINPGTNNGTFLCGTSCDVIVSTYGRYV